MAIDIPQDISLRLQEMAQRQDMDVGDLLRDMIKRYGNERDNGDSGQYATWGDLLESAREADIAQWATLADLASHAKELNMASPEPVDTASRSREILNTEYADYLKNRIDRSP